MREKDSSGAKEPKNSSPELQGYVDELLGDLTAQLESEAEAELNPESFDRRYKSLQSTEPRPTVTKVAEKVAEEALSKEQRDSLNNLLSDTQPKVAPQPVQQEAVTRRQNKAPQSTASQSTAPQSTASQSIKDRATDATPTKELVESKKSANNAEPLKKSVAQPVYTGDWDGGMLSGKGRSKKTQANKEEEVFNVSLEWLENGRPAWAQKRFDCLFFEVSGTLLALPLVTLGSVHVIDDEIRKIVGQAKLFLGMAPINGTNYKVIDTAKLVMPEKYLESMRDNYKYLISLDGSGFSLAVDQIKNSKSIEPDQVKWRQNRTARTWLAGTLKEHMCVILDAGALISLSVK